MINCTLSVVYRPLLSENGLREVKVKDKVASFTFVNEVFVRFAHTTGDYTRSSPIYKIYLYECAEAEITSREFNCDIDSGLDFFVDDRFNNIIQTCFAKHFITDDNIHEYVFRITANPLNNYVGEFLRISIARHDIDLDRYEHSPANTDMLIGEISGEWSEEELTFIREIKAVIPSLPKPLTRGQFCATYCDKFGMDKKQRADTLWDRKKEVGLI